MLFSLLSSVFAQDYRSIYSVSKDSKGIECVFAEPFITFRYDFQAKILSKSGMDVPVEIYSAELKQKESSNPFMPEYQLLIKEQSKPYLRMIFDNSGSDGMSEKVHPLSVYYWYQAGGTVQGGCFFVDHFGTHIVVDTYDEPEPWLNLRAEPSIQGDIIKKLRDGTELNVLETKKGWVKIQVVRNGGIAETGWVSNTYIRKKVPS